MTGEKLRLLPLAPLLSMEDLVQLVSAVSPLPPPFVALSLKTLPLYIFPFPATIANLINSSSKWINY